MSIKFKKKLSQEINQSINAKKSLLKKSKKIYKIIQILIDTIINNKKILICGNGGSAADAQHIAAECLVRLRPKNDRKPIAMLSLALDTSTITACSNDYSFSELFSRNLKALGKEGDSLIVISTSGNSKNIIKALKVAKKLKIKTIAFLGGNGGKAKKIAENSIIVNSRITARIQESHIFLGHLVVSELEQKLMKLKLI